MRGAERSLFLEKGRSEVGKEGTGGERRIHIPTALQHREKKGGGRVEKEGRRRGKRRERREVEKE